MPYHYYGTPGLFYGSGAAYGAYGSVHGGKNMEIAYNLTGLDDRQVLQKVKAAHDALADKPLVYVTPSPTLAATLSSHDAALANLDLIDSLEAQLVTARLARPAAMDDAKEKYFALGSYVLNLAMTQGNSALVTDATFSLAQGPSPVPAMGKVSGNIVTPGENDGTGRGDWDRLAGAKAYEVQTAATAVGPYTHHSTVTVTHVDFVGMPSGEKLWTRVRAINKLGPGPWSDPACCTIP